MNEYRVTKYNPANRNEQGSYIVDEWTDFSDIGQEFGGVELTLDMYLEVENAYVSVVLSIFEKMNVSYVTIRQLEKHTAVCQLHNNQKVMLSELSCVIRSVLRSQYWCKLVAENCFVHFGYDFYMYIGCSMSKEEVGKSALKNGLFAEEIKSPYS